MACSRMRIIVALLFGRSDEYRETDFPSLTKGPMFLYVARRETSVTGTVLPMPISTADEGEDQPGAWDPTSVLTGSTTLFRSYGFAKKPAISFTSFHVYRRSPEKRVNRRLAQIDAGRLPHVCRSVSCRGNCPSERDACPAFINPTLAVGPIRPFARDASDETAN
jgi:hypothetical protein